MTDRPGHAGSLSRRGLVAAIGALAAVGCERSGAVSEPLTLFAAASLRDALETVASLFEARANRTVRLSFAASGAVARQIEAGAPADVVILADGIWMDRLQAAGELASGSRRDLLTNRLVLIAPEDQIVDGDPFDWLLARHDGRLAIGDPSSVPAGRYAREWLRRIGWWARLEPRVALVLDVRAVRDFVARGEAQLGVVYRSDLIGAAGIRRVFEPPLEDQPRIVYPAAANRTAREGAISFLDFLQGTEASTVFRRFGFQPIGASGA